ncbi:MAG: hypothetical protein HYR94_03555 [Chloroflexi bacterium]|nr:hypothetical protein [Chloroflexota bacterium]
MNKHPTALMLSLVALLLAVMGLIQLQKVWKYVLLTVSVVGAIVWWIIYFNLLVQSLW